MFTLNNSTIRSLDGFAEYLLGINLTVVPELHSHLEPMGSLRIDELKDQITLSYFSQNGVDNVINLPGPFPKDADPTRYQAAYNLRTAVDTVNNRFIRPD